MISCGKCGDVYYCGVEHQKLDYADHQQMCERLYQKRLQVDQTDQNPNLNRLRALDQDENDGFNIEQIALEKDITIHLENVKVEDYKIYIENLEQTLLNLRQRKRTESILQIGCENRT